MRLGLTTGSSGRRVTVDLDMILEAEKLGYDIVRTSEFYGADAVTTATWTLANTTKIHVGTGIMQFGARTPAMTAMTSISLDHLSGGRFRPGLGLSGPQVIEGWHGRAFGKPLGQTREYISIMRQIFAREAPLEHDGAYFQIPYRGADATGLGKPLKSIPHGRADLPIYLAAMGPKNITLAAEVADGVIPGMFSPEKFPAMKPLLEDGFAKSGNGKGFDTFDLCIAVPVSFGDDAQECRDRLKPYYARYIGGMGAREVNFHNANVRRLGFDDMADRIQVLYLDGKQDEAIAAVDDDFIDEVALCGPKDRIRERLTRYQALPVSTFQVRFPTTESIRLMAELLL
ncbi:MAG: LLM class F420-dependent oxidoreductase [Rhodospirillaceae bacterium]|jgi:F420-dependent oxidoreductase-like protein|nr:LLM class F420-dependent oxidoreductase [Rhodospirillaceae bacterium]